MTTAEVRPATGPTGLELAAITDTATISDTAELAADGDR